MNDTPRTDAASFGSQVMAHEMVHADFARELERENAELKESNDFLDEAVTAALRDRDYFLSRLREAENRELKLLKDTERLDWILNNNMVTGEWETSEDDGRTQYQVIYQDRKAIDAACRDRSI